MSKVQPLTKSKESKESKRLPSGTTDVSSVATAIHLSSFGNDSDIIVLGEDLGKDGFPYALLLKEPAGKKRKIKKVNSKRL